VIVLQTTVHGLPGSKKAPVADALNCLCDSQMNPPSMHGEPDVLLNNYLASSKAPNHFLRRAKTQALRGERLGDKPEKINVWLSAVSEREECKLGQPLSSSLVAQCPQKLVPELECAHSHEETMTGRGGLTVPLNSVLPVPEGSFAGAPAMAASKIATTAPGTGSPSNSHVEDKISSNTKGVAKAGYMESKIGNMIRGCGTTHTERIALEVERLQTRPSLSAKTVGNMKGSTIVDRLPPFLRNLIHGMICRVMPVKLAQADRDPTPCISEASWLTVRSSKSTMGVQRRSWQSLVGGTKFNMAAICIVILHALFLAVETDMDFGSGPDSIAFLVDASFTGVYIAEMLLRLWALGGTFFHDGWNNIDMVLVVLSVIDLVVVAVTTSPDPSLSVVSTFRLVRLARLARLVRLLRFFKPLWLLVCGIAVSMKTVFWAWSLIGLIVYIVGLVFARVFAPHTCKADDSGESVDEELAEYFGNVSRAMFSVFQIITMEDWPFLADIASRHEPWTLMLFFVLLATCTWGVMHVITAVFVEGAVAASSLRSIDIAKKAKEEREHACKHLARIFRRADVDNDGTLSKQEFQDVLKDPIVVEQLQEVGIDKTTAARLFDVLDLDGSQTLDGHEFVEGVLRSRGSAQNKDVIGTRCDVWRAQSSVEYDLQRAIRFIEKRVEYTTQRVEALRRDAMPLLRVAARILAPTLQEGNEATPDQLLGVPM